MRTKLVTILGVLALVVALAATPASGEGAPAAGPTPPDGPAAEAAPAEATVLGGIRAMATGYYHSCALLSSGQVRCSGYNGYGELGNGTDDDHTRAVLVRGTSGPLTNVVALAAGVNHTCALLSSGQMRCWGDNGEGQLGIGTLTGYRLRPAVVKNGTGSGPLTGVVGITADGYHTCAVLNTGQARCWGYNDTGQLGDDTEDSRPLPRTVKNVSGSGPLTGVTQIDTGYYFTCARLSNSQARCWGYNDEGQLGNDTTGQSNLPVVVKNVPGTGPLTTVRRISAGAYHACAVLNNNQARCWGYNTDGVLGDGTDDDRHLPVVVENRTGTGPLTGIRHLDAAYYHSCALLIAREVRCWGENTYDQIGNGIENGPDVLRPAPVRNTLDTGNLVTVVQLQTTDYHTCVTLANHQGRCWGYDSYGALGNGGNSQSPLPVKFTR
jgi:alpha-tubulin suppressor-like RCC1 family protein